MEDVVKLRHAELSDRLSDGVDVLICSASFESRCLSIPLSLPPDAVRKAFVFEGSEDVGGLRVHARRICEHLGSNAKRVSIDLSDPLSVADGVFQSLSIYGSETEHVLVDITTFTRETLLIILRTLHDVLPKNAKVKLAYTAAQEYAVGLIEEEKWLARGISDIRSVLGYPGSMVPTRKFHLVVMVGFEHERATRLIETFEPASLSLGFGAPGISINDRLQAINAEFHKRLVNMYGPVISFEFSCVNPQEVYRTLNHQIEVFPRHNVVIAPLNTKISVVGAGLCALHNEDVQLCYAAASSYNIDGYSVPSDDCYLFSISSLLHQRLKQTASDTVGA